MITGINYKLGICTAIIGFASFGIGLVLAQNSQVIIEIKDGYRFIESNAIPNHTTGRFPNRSISLYSKMFYGNARFIL